jgi:hypothetical protein
VIVPVTANGVIVNHLHKGRITMKIATNLLAEASGVILSIVVLIAGVGAAFGITQHQLNKHEEQLQEMENQYKKDHDILLEIKRDVHWIRSVVEEKP